MFLSFLPSPVILELYMWIALLRKQGIRLKNKSCKGSININKVQPRTTQLLSIQKELLQMEGRLSHLKMVRFNLYAPLLSFP